VNDDDLTRLCAAGTFAVLDVHFSRLLTRLNGEVVPGLSLAAAMVSRYTREGHICLDLREVAGKRLVSDPEARPCPELSDWCEKLRGSRVVGSRGEFKPLILDHEQRLYLYRYWQYQQKLAEALKARLAESSGGGSSIESTTPSPPSPDGRGGGTGAPDGTLKEQLERLFPSAGTGEVDWQKVAAFAAASKAFCVISGGPGTGKTTTVARILALLLEQSPAEKLRMALAAPTGKAAARLQETIKEAKEKKKLNCSEPIRQAIPETASTIHRLLGAIQGSPYFRYHEGNPLPLDVVVVDEASMVDLALMSKLFQALPRQARVILLGDKDQLASVEAGAVLGDICETGRRVFFSQGFVHAVEDFCSCKLEEELVGNSPANKPKDCLIQLQKSYRFAEADGISVLSRKVRDSDSSGAMAVLKRGEFPDVSWNEVSSGRFLNDAIKDQIVEGFNGYFQAVAEIRRHPHGDPATRIQEVFDLLLKFRILCAVREGLCGVGALNRLVEDLFQEQQLLIKESKWYVGRPILIGRNDYNLHLFNGDVGIFLPDLFSGAAPRVFFPGQEGRFRAFHPLRLPEHETVFATTVHKSQGSEFDQVMFILPDRDSPVLTRELVYTAITRARQRVSLWGPEKSFLAAVSRSTRRMSGLTEELWDNPGGV
jgi:exodeoxyribonuclease V alpha subunit